MDQTLLVVQLNKFKKDSALFLNLLFLKNIKNLCSINNIIGLQVKSSFEKWFGIFNYFSNELSDDKFYLEFEGEFFKESFKKILEKSIEFDVINNKEILEFPETENNIFEENISIIKNEYFSIFNKKIEFDFISPENWKDFFEEEKKESEKNIIDNTPENRKEKNKLLSTKEKFALIKKEKFYKHAIKEFTKLYFVIRKKSVKKERSEKILRQFTSSFNEFFGTNINPNNVPKEFYNYFYQKIDTGGFKWAVRYWILIVGIPLIISILVPVLMTSL